jgi:predicted RecA/RadA family phage recombinase
LRRRRQAFGVIEFFLCEDAMKNFVQDGSTLEVTMPYQRNSGEGVQIGNGLFGVATGTYANAVAGIIATEGVFDLAKTGGQAVTAGNRVFWDNTGKLVTTTATANLAIGVATQAALAGDATVRVRLCGSTPAGT